MSLNFAFLFLVACGSGEHADGFITPLLREIYIPLSQNDNLFLVHSAAATVVAPNIAVTNAHNSALVSQEDILAQSGNYDLLFFRTDYSVTPNIAVPSVGQQVSAYGQNGSDDLREARGMIQHLDQPVIPRCDDCPVQRAFTFDANGGPGFSGGPVVEEHTGTLVGIVFGYRDNIGAGADRQMYAYEIALVTSEMNRLLSPNPP